jgi:hypothetical protein
MLALSFHACGSSDDPEITTQYYLQGTVRDASSSEPIAGAEITLLFGGTREGEGDYGDEYSVLHQGRTDDEGSFSFPISQAGIYMFFVSADGYEDTEKLFPLTDLSKNEVTITMASNLSTELTDRRDGKTYNTKTFGLVTWMIADLRYGSATGTYTWADALRACPSGWHLPNNTEWSALRTVSQTQDISTYFPSGGNWWSATEDGSTSAYYWYGGYQVTSSYRGTNKTNTHAVRCVRD